MEYLILLLVVAAVLFVIMAGVSLVCKRLDQYCVILDLRRRLLARLGGTRLGRMLGRLNIRLPDYVQAQPIAAVEDQLASCERCGSQEACDHYLEGDEAQPASAPGFCPNRERIDRLAGK